MFSPDPEKLVYWANIEFTYEPGSKHHGEFEGGYVYVFVQAMDARDAMDQFQLEFASLKLGIRFVEFVSLYAEVPWHSEEDQEHYDAIATLASSTEEVIFDSFEVYERR
ncbi:MAG: hypothetical protein R3F31_23490 [Verrucomicrobiales bacterium]|nr:hypothetical protein [Verrucomicrobiae bacterium]MCC6884134.1 hypothetical protein [Verrucomicrobiales bacterium]MCP5554079.1 hypothetical protein [Akkermansiaceae bacterium]HRX55997.1 hypothetical protein [Verrucomicrobiales bacterium]